MIVVTDNCAAMKKTVKNYIWVGCAAHNLNLVLKHTFEEKNNLKEFQDTLKYCKKLVSAVHHSKYEHILDYTLRQEVAVRWNLKHSMVESVEKNFEKLTELSTTNVHIAELLNPINKTTVVYLKEFLEPIKAFQERLSQEKDVTINEVLPIKLQLTRYAAASENDISSKISLKDTFVKNLNKYFVVGSIHLAATFLTPKYRKLLNSEETESTKSFLNHLLVEERETNNLQDEDRLDTATKDFDNSVSGLSKNVDLLYSVADFEDDEDVHKIDSTHLDLESYCNIALKKIDKTMPVIQYWKTLVGKYPKLSEIALWILATPATSVPSERNFSYAGAGLNVNDRRTRLVPEKLDNLLFFRSNKDLFKMYINVYYL